MYNLDDLDISIPYDESVFSTVGTHWIKSISQKIFYLIRVRIVNGTYLYSQSAYIRISSNNPDYYEVHHTINSKDGESIGIIYLINRTDYKLDEAKDMVSEFESSFNNIKSVTRSMKMMLSRTNFSIDNIEYPPLKLVFNNSNTIDTSSIVKSSENGYYSFNSVDKSRIYLFTSDDNPVISNNYKDELSPIGFIDINNDTILLNISMNPVYITVTGSLSSLGVDEVILLYDSFINCATYNKMLNLVTTNEFTISDTIHDISVGWFETI